jgi:hypothetical protein
MQDQIRSEKGLVLGAFQEKFQRMKRDEELLKPDVIGEFIRKVVEADMRGFNGGYFRWDDEEVNKVIETQRR